MTKYEYLQDIVRPSKTRFDSVLNKRAREGWKVENIEKLDGNERLVTYSRELHSSIRISYHKFATEAHPDNPTHVEVVRTINKLAQERKLLHFAQEERGSYTCVWEV